MLKQPFEDEEISLEQRKNSNISINIIINYKYVY